MKREAEAVDAKRGFDSVNANEDHTSVDESDHVDVLKPREGDKDAALDDVVLVRLRLDLLTKELETIRDYAISEHRRANVAEVKLRSVFDSRSWRVTKPLRLAVRLLRTNPAHWATVLSMGADEGASPKPQISVTLPGHDELQTLRQELLESRESFERLRVAYEDQEASAGKTQQSLEELDARYRHTMAELQARYEKQLADAVAEASRLAEAMPILEARTQKLELDQRELALRYQAQRQKEKRVLDFLRELAVMINR